MAPHHVAVTLVARGIRRRSAAKLAHLRQRAGCHSGCVPATWCRHNRPIAATVHPPAYAADEAHFRARRVSVSACERCGIDERALLDTVAALLAPAMALFFVSPPVVSGGDVASVCAVLFRAWAESGATSHHKCRWDSLTTPFMRRHSKGIDRSVSFIRARQNKLLSLTFGQHITP